VRHCHAHHHDRRAIAVCVELRTYLSEGEAALTHSKLPRATPDDLMCPNFQFVCVLYQAFSHRVVGKMQGMLTNPIGYLQ
jgi:hypothetical protein